MIRPSNQIRATAPLVRKIAQHATSISQNMVGTTQRILIEGYSRKVQTNYAVEQKIIAWLTFIGDPNRIGRSSILKLQRRCPIPLRGEILK